MYTMLTMTMHIRMVNMSKMILSVAFSTKLRFEGALVAFLKTLVSWPENWRRPRHAQGKMKNFGVLE